MSPSKDRETHVDKGQGESALVPLCFNKAMRTRQGREGEADGDEEGDESLARSHQVSQGATGSR